MARNLDATYRLAFGGWPSSGEIDIMEHVGYDLGVVHGSVHTEAYNHKINTQRSSARKIANVDTEFHVYSIIWDKDKISFLLMMYNISYLKTINKGTIRHGLLIKDFTIN